MIPQGSSSQITCDVLVLGGGPAGYSTSIQLAQLGYSVIVLEKTNYTNVRVGEIITPDSIVSLRTIGVLNEFYSQNYSKCHYEKTIWETCDPVIKDFISNPYSNGWQVNRIEFDKMLLKKAIDVGVNVILNCQFSLKDSVNYSTNQWNISLEHKKALNITSKFIVDATGRKSIFSKKIGSKRVIYDKLLGIFGYFYNSEDVRVNNNNHLVIEAVENGWWYIADLPDNKIVVCYLTDPNIWRRLKSKSTGKWLNLLHETKFIQKRIHNLKFEKSPNIVPAYSMITKPLIGKNWLAVGDAAMSFDPLSSQGVNKALKHGILASEVIDKVFKGDFKAIDKYEELLSNEFEEYLQHLTFYYCIQMRFEKSEFWNKKFLNSFEREKISLDPNVELLLNSTINVKASSFLNAVYDKIDFNYLFDIIRTNSQPAYQIVQNIDTKFGTDASEIIRILQLLLKIDILRVKR